ncbi:probable pectinesterase/pectinesterase inhibitor 51 [Macadamia integrifolia]|uniref:probable pectinesterase/pectinesterase inhibitor 51 n=1 Tax=Macadamia integrifolia TaxID=60698 RepID=UPI001C4F308C|nr:probable pectinesterase/pectinesterase inhibitor 51 [Macadamia integrifolia]
MQRKSIKFSKPSNFLFLAMACLFSIALLSLLLIFSLSCAKSNHHLHPSPNQKPSPTFASAPPVIRQACKATRFPNSCEGALIQSSNLTQNAKPIEIIQAAMSISAQNLKTAQSMVKNILDRSSGNLNRSKAAMTCLEVLHNSEYRLSSAADVLPRGRMKDARAWMSAALCYQYDCWSGLQYVNDSQMVNQTMAFFDSLMGLTSNALSMMISYDLFRDKLESWKPPMTERSGFWEDGGVGGSVSGYKGGFPAGLSADVTVCKDEGSGCYKTVQAAVDAAPDNHLARKFVISIKAGVYEEIVRVPLEKKNLVFVGDGMGKTIITGSLSVAQSGITTYNTATVGVLGDGFMARDLTIQNTAGPDVHQAVAFRLDSDLSIIENCELLGNQDTLYAHSLRQYYKGCRIEGNVDFIFGNSAAVFQDSLILVRPRQVKPEKGENNAVTAQGRTDPAQSTGFVFQNCLINGTDEYMGLYHSKPKVHKNFLGRPWKEYSRAVFIHCNLESLISPTGWLPWRGNFALSTLYYGEFENSGAGANVTGRVKWSSRIPEKHLYAYSLQNFIQGDEWISTSS